MKIAIIGNQARAMSNFWTVLITTLINQRHEVLCVIPPPTQKNTTDDKAWEDKLNTLGATIVHYPLDRKGLNPVRDCKTLLAFRRILLEHKPDIMFATTIKPILYASFAAKWTQIPAKQNVHVMITGLGYMFEGNTFFKKILKVFASLLYRLAFYCVQTVIFQNKDDKKLFIESNILTAEVDIVMSRGTGIDLEKFAETPLPVNQPFTFLFIGRLLEAKGLRELYQAACMLKEKHPTCRIQILGPAEEGVGAIALDEVKSWQHNGVIEYLGSSMDVRPFIEKANVIVLPSWREGTPTALMEAMSMGRPLIAADVPGSREVVINGINGYLFPVHDVKALAETMELFFHNTSLVADMAHKSRIMAEENFNAKFIAKKLMRTFRIQE